MKTRPKVRRPKFLLDDSVFDASGTTSVSSVQELNNAIFQLNSSTFQSDTATILIVPSSISLNAPIMPINSALKLITIMPSTASPATLDGGNQYSGFVVLSGNVQLTSLTLQNMYDCGGTGCMGAGAGLFVANLSNTSYTQSGGTPNVTLTNVSFLDNTAQGGSSGASPAQGGAGGGNGADIDGSGSGNSGSSGANGNSGPNPSGADFAGQAVTAGYFGVAGAGGAGGNGGGGGSGGSQWFWNNMDGGNGGNGGQGNIGGLSGYGGGGGAGGGGGGGGGGGSGGANCFDSGSDGTGGQGGSGGLCGLTGFGGGTFSVTAAGAAGGGSGGGQGGSGSVMGAGAGFGGGVFAMGSASLNFAGTGAISGNGANAGASMGDFPATGAGNGIFLQGSGTLYFHGEPTDVYTVSDQICDEAGAVALSLTYPRYGGPWNNDGIGPDGLAFAGGDGAWRVIIQSDGTVEFSGSQAFSGSIKISSGTLDLSGATNMTVSGVKVANGAALTVRPETAVSLPLGKLTVEGDLNVNDFTALTASSAEIKDNASINFTNTGSSGSVSVTILTCPSGITCDLSKISVSPTGFALALNEQTTALTLTGTTS